MYHHPGDSESSDDLVLHHENIQLILRIDLLGYGGALNLVCHRAHSHLQFKPDILLKGKLTSFSFCN